MTFQLFKKIMKLHEQTYDKVEDPIRYLEVFLVIQ